MKRKLTQQPLIKLREMQVGTMQYLRDQGISFNIDPAVPQQWLNAFSDWCEKRYPDLTYHLILSTTAWNMNDSPFGKPITICTEVQKALDEYGEENS